MHMMAVRPDAQARGLGSQLLTRVLASTADRQAHLRTVLTTHQARNLVFYRKLGFEVIDERVLHPPRSARYTVWSMARSAAGAGG